MAYDEKLTARVREMLKGRSDITEQKMFGGVAFLCNRRMCCGVAGRDLVVRVVDTEMAAALESPHVRPMDLTGRPLRGFVFVSPRGCGTRTGLRKWVAEGLRFVEQNYGADVAGRKSTGTRPTASARRRSRPRK